MYCEAFLRRQRVRRSCYEVSYPNATLFCFGIYHNTAGLSPLTSLLQIIASVFTFLDFKFGVLSVSQREIYDLFNVAP